MSPKLKAALVHGALFAITFFTTTLAGSEWVYSKSILSGQYTWDDFFSGLPYSVTFLLILTAHEFGHYFMAVYYRIKTTLPFFIPLPPMFLSLGTLGALIRIKSRIHSKQQNFDIGIAGPLAGFVVAVVILVYAFTHLPPAEHIFQFHPEYEQYGLNYQEFVYTPEHLPPGTVDVIVGKNLMFLFFERFVGDPARIPNPHELIHYPLLFAAFLSLVFTSINLLPIGQLDGGHVLYGLLGFKMHRAVASVIFCLFLLYACLGVLGPGQEFDFIRNLFHGQWFESFGLEVWHVLSMALSIILSIGFLYLCLGGLRVDRKSTLMLAVVIFAIQYFTVMTFPGAKGYSGWLLFALIIGRFVSIPHPQTEIEEPLTLGRKILGWIALLIFILCFTPAPLEPIIAQ